MNQTDTALIQTLEIHKAHPPAETDVTFLRKWLDSTKKGCGRCFLRGRETEVWEPLHEKDFIVLSQTSEEKDIFSKWVTKDPLTYFHQAIGQRILKTRSGDEETGFVDYSGKTIASAMNVLGTVLASLFPVASTLVLYFLRSNLARLGAIAGFMTLFSMTLAVFTKARRIEIFGATAAYVISALSSPKISLSHCFGISLLDIALVSKVF